MLSTRDTWQPVTHIVGGYTLSSHSHANPKMIFIVRKNVPSALACSHMVIAEILKEQSTFETFRNKPCSRQASSRLCVHSLWVSSPSAEVSLSQRMSEASEEEKLYLYSQSLDGRHTVGINFDLYHRYCLQAKVSNFLVLSEWYIHLRPYTNHLCMLNIM